MGRTNRQTKHDRIWKLGQQKARSCSKDLARKIEKTKEAMNADFITKSLKCQPNFLGCFAQNQFENFTVNQYPTFMIVNTDSYNMKGSHWLAIGIFEKTIEIFDPLGFQIFNWNQVPCQLLSFLHRMSLTRRVIVCPQLQSFESHFCGFYCIFYLILRQFTSLSYIVSFFHLLNRKLHRNDSILYKFFK